jgi:hypothetical protein
MIGPTKSQRLTNSTGQTAAAYKFFLSQATASGTKTGGKPQLPEAAGPRKDESLQGRLQTTSLEFCCVLASKSGRWSFWIICGVN